MLIFLGRFGKGFATVLGLVTVLVSVVFADNPNKLAAVLDMVRFLQANVPLALTVLGALLTAFGVGRKAGVAATSALPGACP